MRRRPKTLATPPPAPAAAPMPINLPQQKADFTAEGSPPPGRVANGPPQLEPDLPAEKADAKNAP